MKLFVCGAAVPTKKLATNSSLKKIGSPDSSTKIEQETPHWHTLICNHIIEIDDKFRSISARIYKVFYMEFPQALNNLETIERKYTNEELGILVANAKVRYFWFLFDVVNLFLLFFDRFYSISI